MTEADDTPHPLTPDQIAEVEEMSPGFTAGYAALLRYCSKPNGGPPIDNVFDAVYVGRAITRLYLAMKAARR